MVSLRAFVALCHDIIISMHHLVDDKNLMMMALAYVSGKFSHMRNLKIHCFAKLNLKEMV